MAITKTEVLQRCEVFLAMNPEADRTTNQGNPTVNVLMEITFDDADDAELPAVSTHSSHLQRFDEEGNPTDVSGYPQLVRDICAGVWADD